MDKKATDFGLFLCIYPPFLGVPSCCSRFHCQTRRVETIEEEKRLQKRVKRDTLYTEVKNEKIPRF